MPTRELEVAEEAGVRYAAILVDGQPTDLMAERCDRPDLTDALILGRVVRIDRSGAAAFLDLGLDRPGYLPLRAGTPPAAGRLLPVRVVAEPREAKGIEVTRDVALTGRTLVRLPYAPTPTASRRLPPAARRAWRSRLTGGWIVRSAAAEVEEGAVLAEAARLEARWASIEGRIAAAIGPTVLAPPPEVGQRLLLDAAGVEAIRIADDGARRRWRPWLEAAVPELSARLSADAVGILDVLPELLEPTVPLQGGGAITIEATRALTAVDVDAGAARDALRTNREAAAAVARQIRLRNLGGLIVIDLITPADGAARRRVLADLRAALADDPLRPQLGDGVTRFGLVEVARRRRGRPLACVLAP